jgi:hypothetical protein
MALLLSQSHRQQELNDGEEQGKEDPDGSAYLLCVLGHTGCCVFFPLLAFTPAH